MMNSISFRNTVLSHHESSPDSKDDEKIKSKRQLTRSLRRVKRQIMFLDFVHHHDHLTAGNASAAENHVDATTVLKKIPHVSKAKVQPVSMAPATKNDD